jgi:hypothetical protein
LHYLGNIKKGLLALVGGDLQALKGFDRPTVTALELRAPGASTADAQFLRNQIRGGAIFSAFTDHERDRILDRLPMVDGLILTLSSFFRDLNYLQLLVDCLKRLVVTPPRKGVCETIQSKYTGVNQQEGQVKIQVAEDTFISKSGTDADRVDLGCRQLIALAMRYYPYMPRDPIREDAVRKATTRADQTVLRQLADLAYELGFKTPQIDTLRQHSSSRITGDDDPQFPPLHVTSGCGIEMRQRSGIPRAKAYKEDRYSLFINHLHDIQAYQDEGITSFFVRKSVYLAFFGRPDEASSSSAFDSTHTSQSQGRPQYVNNDIDDIVSSYNRRESTSELLSNQERLEQERRNQDRREQERQEEETREEERLELERREQGRLEQERLEQERLEQERLEQERLEQERLEQERLEEERRELRRIEETLEREDVQERLAQALQAQENLRQQNRRQQEQEKQEQEREEEERHRQEIRERGRREQEALVQGRTLNDPERVRKRHTQIDMESLVSGAIGNQTDVSATSQAQEQEQETAGSDIQSGRELVAADPSLNTARNLQELERQRQDQDRREEERQEQERQEQERQEQERQERQEQERQEQERLEQERLELRRIEERLEREGLQERLAQALQAQKTLDQEKQRQQQREKQEQEKQEEERRRQETREQGRREQEALLQGRTLNDLKRAKKRHTQIDMESLVSDASGNQRGVSAAGLQSGRELVVANSSSNTVQEGLEQESLEQERLERERLEQERLEREKLERLEQERLERVKLQESFAQKLREQEKIDQEKKEQMKREQEQKQQELEQEKRELERRKGERQRRERREQGRWEQEKTVESEGGLAAESTEPRPRRRQVRLYSPLLFSAGSLLQDPTPLAQTPDSVWITFKVWERGVWRTAQSLHVYSSNPSEVERIAVKYIRKREQIRAYDTDLNILTPQMCFQAAIANGSNMLLLIPEKEIDISEELEASVSQLLSESGSQMEIGIE